MWCCHSPLVRATECWLPHDTWDTEIPRKASNGLRKIKQKTYLTHFKDLLPKYQIKLGFPYLGLILLCVVSTQSTCPFLDSIMTTWSPQLTALIFSLLSTHSVDHTAEVRGEPLQQSRLYIHLCMLTLFAPHPCPVLALISANDKGIPVPFDKREHTEPRRQMSDVKAQV